MPRPILVTGGGGLLGRAVVRRLVAGCYDVRVHLGPPGCGLASPVSNAPSAEAYLDDARAWPSLVAGVGAVIHLAGPASVAASFDDPVGHARAHAVGTGVLVTAATAAGVPRFVHVSSAEVYGQPDINPVEETAPTRPRSPYAAVKLAAETLVTSLAQRHDFSAVVLRPFSVYGAESPPGSLVGALLGQVRRGLPPLVQDPRPVRDYVHVTDVADAIVRAAAVAPKGACVLNVGTGVGTSVAELAELLMGLTGRAGGGVGRIPGNRPEGLDILDLVCDPRAAEKALGWRPRVELAEGLRRALAGLDQPDAP